MLGALESFKLPYARFMPTTWPYQKKVSKEVNFLRTFCKDRILQRQQAISQASDPVPDDILTTYLNNVHKAGLGLEDITDDILTLFIAGRLHPFQ